MISYIMLPQNHILIIEAPRVSDSIFVHSVTCIQSDAATSVKMAELQESSRVAWKLPSASIQGPPKLLPSA